MAIRFSDKYIFRDTPINGLTATVTKQMQQKNNSESYGDDKSFCH